MIGILHWTVLVGAGPLVAGAVPCVVPAIPAQDPVRLDESGAAAAQATKPRTDDEWRARELELLERIDRLEDQLREFQRSSLARQEEWLEYMRVLQSFELKSLPEPPEFIAEALKPPPDPLEEAAAREARRLEVRAGEILRKLEAQLVADGVRHLDVLEVGRLHEYEGRGVTGPVVARALDGRGRMVGMMRADHMRIDVSRSARSVTLVLEGGYEMRSGAKKPFEGDVRRIFLGSIDPEPWVEAFPELVDARALSPVVDDGLWDVAAVRADIARLLNESARAGNARWQLVTLGGVRNSELRDVQLVERNGALGSERRVFADVGRIRAPSGGRGIEIELSDGTLQRGGRVAPFLDGRYRIVLPFADAETWRAAGVPGLGVPRDDPPQ